MPKPTKIQQALATTKLIAKVEGKDVLPHIPLPKPKSPIKTPRKKKNDMREKKLEQQICFALEMDGHKVAKAGEQSTYNNKYMLSGMSDLLVFVKHYGIVFLEVKTEKGRQRASQREFQALCETCHLPYYIVRSPVEAVMAIKKELTKVA